MRSNIGTVTMAVAAALLVGVTAAEARRTHEPGDGVPDSIHYYESVGMMSSAAESSIGQEGEATDISFVALGRQFDLKLEPNTVYAQGAMVVWVDDTGTVEEPAEEKGRFFRGRVDGDPHSWVRVSLDGGDLSGVVSTDKEVYFLEPAKRFFGPEAAGETIAYRLSDTDTEWTADSCAASDHQPRALRRAVARARAERRSAAERLGQALSEVSAAATTLQRAEIGMIADYEYFSRHGVNSAFAIADLINAVDGIYEAEVGVRIEIVTTVIYDTPNDPFSGATDPNTILSEFSSWKDNNDNSPGQLLYGVDLAQLISGRDLDGYTIGIAWLGTLCSSYYGSSVVQDFTTSMTGMTLLLAHEMGHNFGAPHDAQTGSPCVNEPATYIMNPVLSETLQQKFSACSKSFINPEVAGASCMDSVTPPPPPALTLNPLSSPLMVGAPLTLTGTGFTPGSVLVVFLAAATGTEAHGPYTPNSRSSTMLGFNQFDPTMPLGNGFVSLLIVNTDQNFIQSNGQSQYVYGNPGSNIPTITAINGVGLRALQEGVPVANVETAIPQGSTVTITGMGFHGAVVNLYTPFSAYALPVRAGATSTSIQIDIPAGAPTGPGALQVINNPFTGNVQSNAVSVPIGAPLTITRVTQQGNLVTVQGTGFSPVSVINLFNAPPNGSAMNLGGYGAKGPNIPLNVVSDTTFTFTVPAGAVSGSAYVQVINPPFTPFSCTNGDPDGAFTLTVP